jgi:uncharacterized protein (DUF2141 family)
MRAFSPVSFCAAALLLATARLCVLAQETPKPAESKAGSEAGCALRIHVDGFRNTKGNLGTILFTAPDGWPESLEKSFRHGPAPIDPSTRTATAVWPDLPAGDYGVAAIHDENSNHKLDRNFIGIPKEGFGFANNPRVTLSAPAFDEAKVHVACPATDVTIHLIYK